jgi:hypothetical protein
MKPYLLAGILSAGMVVNCFADKVLILSTSVYGGLSSPEAQIATGMGFGVDVVTPAVWQNMLPSDFTKYRAIILGDPGCGGVSDVTEAEANTSTWGPVVNGNIIIIGTDPTVHPPGGPILITNGIAFATAQPGKTGLYCCLSCYYWYAAPNTPVTVLNGLGTFEVSSAGNCYNESHIVATSPTMNGLTDAILSDWSCSVHEGFTVWPNSFIPVAIAEGSGSSYTASDLTVGMPYILASGANLTPITTEITLTPSSASNPTNSLHTVCAKVVQNGAYAVGATVTFTVVSGPNAGVTGQAVTDSSGNACFTYQGNGGIGVDTISASAVDSHSNPINAYVHNATKTWFNPCGFTSLAANIPIVTCGSNVVSVFFNKLVAAPNATNTANYSLDNGLTVTNVSYSGQNPSSIVNVQANGDFIYGTTYTLTISNIFDLCGDELTPDPTVLTFSCTPSCPGVTCPSNIVAQCTGPAGTVVNFDVEPAPGCTNTVIAFPPSGSTFPPGTNTVTAMTVDGGYSNMCTFTVTVVDTVPPVIQCPSNIVINTSCSNVPVSYDVIATDNCCLASVVCTPSSGSKFPFGTTTVNCLATDCSGNTNGCSFTVTLNQVPNAGPPVITAWTTNIIICTTNGNCGPMPDATTQVQATDGSETVYISQSIPPGTILCMNTNVTFTVSNACGQATNVTAKVLVGPCDCAPITSLPWPSKPVSIDVFEGNGVVSQHSFSINPFNPELLAEPGGPTPTNYDFADTNGQFYDVYLSDPDGMPDQNGCCISILCDTTNQLADYSSGNNIDAVEIVFADGSTHGADYVGSVMLGQCLTDPNLLYTSGDAANALGLADGHVTHLGCGLSRITLCFSTPTSPTIVATTTTFTEEPFNLNIGWIDPFYRPWEIQWSTNLLKWNVLSSSNTGPISVTNQITITNINAVTIPYQFYRLHFKTN